MIVLPSAKYPTAQTSQGFFDQLKERLTAVPGVRSVAAASRLPLIGPSWNKQLSLADTPLPTSLSQVPGVAYRLGEPGLFRDHGGRAGERARLQRSRPARCSRCGSREPGRGQEILEGRQPNWEDDLDGSARSAARVPALPPTSGSRALRWSESRATKS